MKRFFSFSKNKKQEDAQSPPDASAGVNLSGYYIKEKDLGKLHKAAWTGDMGKVRNLAKKESSPLDKENRTPLHLACVKGHAEVVETLLEWKAKLNIGDNDQCTPLMKAVQCRKIECIQLLLESRADQNAQDHAGNTCLHYCALDDLIDIATILIKHKAKTEITNSDGHTPLHLATLDKRENMCQLLLEEGANVNAKDTGSIKRTSLMYAAEAGNITLVKMLLHYNADVAIKDSKGWTADDCAVITGQHNCSQLIAGHNKKSRNTPRGRGQSPRQTPRTDSQRSTPSHTSYNTRQQHTNSSKATPAAAMATSHNRPSFDVGSGDDESAGEDTESKISTRHGDDSWGDTDSEIHSTPRHKKSKQKSQEESAMPKLDLTKLLRKSDEDLRMSGKESTARSTQRSADSKIPKPDSSKSASKKSVASVPSNTKSKVPVKKQDSARSVQSERSVKSESWGDSDSEAEEDVPVPTAVKKSPAKTNTSTSKTSSVHTEDDSTGAQDVNGQRNNQTQSTNSVNERSPNKSKDGLVSKEKQKEVLAELGLSDVSDGEESSDFDLSELPTGRSDKEPPLKHSLAKSPKVEGRMSRQSEQSGFDSDEEISKSEDVSHQHTEPKSETGDSLADDIPAAEHDTKQNQDGDWDSGAEERSADHTRPDSQASEYDSELEDAILPREPDEANRKAASALDVPQTAVQDDLSQSLSHSVPKDDESSHTETSELIKRNKTPLQHELLQGEKHSDSLSHKDTAKEEDSDENSSWDSEDGGLPSERDTTPGVTPASTPGILKSNKTAPSESESEEESESEWEREKEKKKELERKKFEEQRQRRWEEQEKEQQEQIKREAEEELRKEEEERDRYKKIKEAEDAEREKQKNELIRKQEDERKAREEEKKKIELEEKRKKERELREQAEKEKRELEERKIKQDEQERKDKEQKERKEQEELERKIRLDQEKRELEKQRMEQQKLEMERIRREKEDLEEKSRKKKLKEEQDSRDRREVERKMKEEKDKRLREAEEERSHQIRLRREKAEKELELARQKQNLSQHMMSRTDDDNTSQTGSDLAELEHMNQNGILSPEESLVNGLGNLDDEDDGLSMSTSTENDIMKRYTSSPYGKGDVSLNTSVNLNDSGALLKIQDQLRQQSNSLKKERDTRRSAEAKNKQLEKENTELHKKVEDVSQAKSYLEQIKLEHEARIREFEYNLSQEVEKRKNAETVLETTKQQLQRKEDHFTHEIEAKQKAELAMKTFQTELRSALSQLKQLEDEKETLTKHLDIEKESKSHLEQTMDEQIRLQQSLQDEASKSTNQKTEVITKLERADENRKSAMDTVDKLKADLHSTKMELERQKLRFRDDHGSLTAENEDLSNKTEDLKNEIKKSEEALNFASMQYSVQLSAVKTENSLLSSNLDRERTSREKCLQELESMKTQLTTCTVELDKIAQARNDLERTSLREREEFNRTNEKNNEELASLKDTNQSQSQRLSDAENKINSLENEHHIANASLSEKTIQLANSQRDCEQLKTEMNHLDQNCRRDKENLAKLQAKLESANERVQSLQHEVLSMKQQLDSTRSSDALKERSVLDTQDKFNIMLSSIRSDHDKVKQQLEDKNHHLQENVSRLREDAKVHDSRRQSIEQDLRRIEKDMSDTSRKLSAAEASLEITNKTREHLEREKLQLTAQMEKISNKLHQVQEREAESKVRIADLTDRLDRAEQDSMMTTQQLHNTSANIDAVSKSKGELEDHVRHLEVENAKLDSNLQNQQQKLEDIQKELDDSHKVRHSLEALVDNLKQTNQHLEDKVNTETAQRSMFAREAEDSKDLWESELKSKSRLGLKIAQLERAKQEAQGFVDEEKRRARRALEFKKTAELKLDDEVNRRSKLEKEVSSLKAHLKASRKRLKALESSESRVNSLHSEFDKERLAMESALATARRQLEEVQLHLQNEIDDKERLETKNRHLQQELNNSQNVTKSNGKLEKMNRKLENELSSYKTQVNSTHIERSEVERLKAEMDMKSRYEINSKLEEVNSYLEEQARARDRLDSMRNTNEAHLRRELDRSKKELNVRSDELSNLRGRYKEAVDEKDNKDFEIQQYRERYENEMKLRDRLADKLQKSTEESAVTKAQLSVEKQKAMLLGSPNGMDGSAFSPFKQNHGVNDSLTYRMKSELDKSIARHLESTPMTELSPSRRAFGDISSLNKSSDDYLSTLKRNYFV